MHNAHIHHWLLIWLFVPLLCRSRTDVWVCVCVLVQNMYQQMFLEPYDVYIYIYVYVCMYMCASAFASASSSASASDVSLSLHCHRHLVSVRVCCFVYSSAGHYLAIGYICVYIYIYKNVPIYLSIYLSLGLFTSYIFLCYITYACIFSCTKCRQPLVHVPHIPYHWPYELTVLKAFCGISPCLIAWWNHQGSPAGSFQQGYSHSFRLRPSHHGTYFPHDRMAVFMLSKRRRNSLSRAWRFKQDNIKTISSITMESPPHNMS